MKDNIMRIATSRATRAGMPEKADEIAQEVRSHRAALRRGELRQMSAIAQRVDALDKLAVMGQKFLGRI